MINLMRFHALKMNGHGALTLNRSTEMLKESSSRKLLLHATNATSIHVLVRNIQNYMLTF